MLMEPLRKQEWKALCVFSDFIVFITAITFIVVLHVVTLKAPLSYE